MTRLWPDGLLLDVVANDEGAPLQIRWGGQQHSVVDITRRWRVRSDWWREAVWRDYFKLTTTGGLLLILFHDLRSDEWYLQRLYD